MRRTQIGKRIELTARDIEIFKLLCQYRYLRSTYIHAFVGGKSVTRFKERLGDLFHEGYLGRPSQQWEFADARHRPAVYEIGTGAMRILRETGAAPGDARTFLSETGHQQFLHSLMICEVLASLELGTRADPGLRFIGWPEMLGKAPEATRSSPALFRFPLPSGGQLVPDGLFGIEYRSGETKTYRFFALEADRGTMPVARSSAGQSSYLSKLGAYREVIECGLYKTRLGLPNLLVLTVMLDEKRLSETMRRFGERGGGATFLFKAAGSLLTPDRQFLGEPWERAGLPPLRINE